MTKGSEAFGRAARRAKVAALYLEGKPQTVIAEAVGASVGTVSLDLKKVMKGWVESSLMDFNERKAQELAKIDRIEAVAWEGWQRSIETQEVYHSRRKSVRQQVRNEDNKVTGHRMVPVEVSDETTVRGQSGDVRFLEQISLCVQMRLRILGLWKGDVTNVNQVSIDWSGLFRAQQDKADQQGQAGAERVLGAGRNIALGGLPSPRPGEVIDHQPLPHEDPVEARIRAEERGAGIVRAEDRG